ncbi:MAG: NAD(P)/FAD-dependent oxidoreductase [Candidatus Angelobacter sp.]
MHSCDVLIAGGGPAGSSCAWALRSSGLRVLILDKATFPRNKVCGGWITPWVLQALEINAEEYARGRTMQNIRGFSVSSLGARAIDVPYDHTVSYGIRRCEFDEYLLRRCGAETREGVAISGIERSGDYWIINGEIKARLLIGAGGHFCPVARRLGNANSDEPVVAQEIEFEMSPDQASSCSIQPEIPELYFCRDFQGYGWCFRKGNFLNIGLGRLDHHGLSHHVSDFVKFLRSTGRVAFDLPGKLSGHAYLLFGYGHRKLVDDSVMLIGDAAGLAFPQSGEGIRPAVESGLLAAGVIKSAEGNYGREQLAVYSDVLKKTVGNGAGSSTGSVAYVPRWLRNNIARFLLGTQWFCRRVVVENWFLR